MSNLNTLIQELDTANTNGHVFTLDQLKEKLSQASAKVPVSWGAPCAPLLR